MDESAGKKQQNRTAINQRFLLKKSSPFLMQEDYKTLRTNVTFSMPGKGCKCIALTSGGRGEGKSTNAVNLALSFGQIGKKVLLIDCDMRLPSVAAKLSIRGRPGLSDVLVEECGLEDAIQTLPRYEIDVLPAGSIPPDPTGLLESEQMEELMQRFREEYDYIFIDLPPILTVSDATIISKYVDGFLLVVKYAQSEYREVQEMVDQLQFVHAKILGFVCVNLSTEDQKAYKKRYYSYGKNKQKR